MTRVVALVLAAVSACSVELHDRDAAFARDDGERVLCGVGVDGDDITTEQLELAMSRANERSEVLIVFAHQPSKTIAFRRLDALFAGAERIGLPAVTFPELATERRAGPGIALGFDDAFVEDWMAMRDILRGRPVTFFVSNWNDLTRSQIDDLHALAADGHAIEAHGMGHRDAASYVDRHGLDRYLADEIDPLIDAMRAEGFAPTTFAYPYGARTSELDDALLERFELVRSLTYLDASSLARAPCPY